MPSYGKYLIFPEHIIEDGASGGKSNIVIEDLDGAELALKKGGQRRRRVSIGGCKLDSLQHQQFQTFCDLVEDEYEPFLFRIVGRCRITSEPIGTGNGANKVFQLQMTREEQGREKITLIKYPDHDYPPRYWPSAPGAPQRLYWPRAPHDGLVHVFVNGVEAALDVSTPQKLFDLRYKGLATLQNAPANGAAVTASAYFYHLMRFEGGSPLAQHRGGGNWVFKDGLQLIEPKGGVDEIYEDVA